MEKENKKEITGSKMAFKIGGYTIVWNWVCLLIPALVVQAIGFEHESFSYELVMVIFKIIAGIFGVKLAVKASFTSSIIKPEEANNSALKAAIISTIISLLFLVVLPLLPTVPLNSVVGIPVIFFVYYLSNLHYIKKMFN